MGRHQRVVSDGTAEDMNGAVRTSFQTEQLGNFYLGHLEYICDVLHYGSEADFNDRMF